jgi:hypothetical protein
LNDSELLMQNAPRTVESCQAPDFLIAKGGPFYALQLRLRLLREDAFRAGPRALLFVFLAWGIPLLLCLVADAAGQAGATRSYLASLPMWSRFVVAVGLFILMEQRVEQRLVQVLRRMVAAPVLSPSSFDGAARAVLKALQQSNAALPEAICLFLAAITSVVQYFRVLHSGTEPWAVHSVADGTTLTVIAWWIVLFSNPLFMFLLFRWLWRLGVWSMLLARLAKLDLRLVATHPDRKAGLGFVGEYPNAYVMFVFAVSCVLGSAMAVNMTEGAANATLLGYVMMLWLVVVLAVFVLPLLAFHAPLKKLKKSTRREYEAVATRYFRAAEREQLGHNIVAADAGEADKADELSDPTKSVNAARLQSTIPFSREALLPLSAAALIPLALAGATQLPVKEILGVFKSILLF